MRCLPWHVSLFPVLIFSALSGSNDRDNQWPVPQGNNKRDYEILKGWFRLSLGSLACKVYFSLSDENSHQFRQNFAYPFFLKLFQSEISALKKKKLYTLVLSHFFTTNANSNHKIVFLYYYKVMWPWYHKTSFPISIIKPILIK